MRAPLPAAFLAAPIAHRAFHNRAQGRPENSLSAVRAAVRAGYGIEIDVQLSSDGQAMVFHDYRLGRLTHARGVVREHTAEELGGFRLRGGKGGIPTLEEILAIVRGRAPLLIEVKDQDGNLGPNVGALEEATARALHGYEGPVALMSFNPHSVAALASLAPHVPRGLTTSAYDYDDWKPVTPGVCDRLREIPDYDRVGASFISHEWADLGRPRVAELKAQGAAILCWTITSPEDEAQARSIADNVTFEGYPAAILAPV